MRNVIPKLLLYVSLVLLFSSSPIRSQDVGSDFLMQPLRHGNYEQIESYVFSVEAIQNDSLDILSRELQNDIDQPELKYLGRYAAAKSAYIKGNYHLARRSLLSLLKELSTLEKTDHSAQLKRAALCMLFFLKIHEGNCQDGLAYINQYGNDLDQEFNCFISGVSRIELGDLVTGIEMLKLELYKKNAPAGYSNKLHVDFCNSIADGYIKLFLKEQKKYMLDTAALYYSKASLLIAKGDVDENYAAALLELRQARILTLRRKFSEALTLYAQAESHFHFQQPATLQLICKGKADCFSQLDDPAAAIQWCDSFLSSYKTSSGALESLLDVYFLLSVNYEKLNKLREANQFTRLLFGEQQYLNSHRLVAVGILHAMDVVQLKKQLQGQLKLQYTTNFSLGSLVVIISVAAGIFFFSRKRKKLVRSFVETSDNSVEQELTGEVEETLPTPGSKDEKIGFQEQSILPIEVGHPVEAPPPIEMIDIDSIEKMVPVLPTSYLLRIQKGLTKFEESKGFIDADLTLAKLSRKLRTNTSYLSQFFNQHMQKGFSDYINDLRIQYVLSELQHNESYKQYTTKAIAAAAGYKNSVTFMNSFKKITGITLSAYIEKETA